MIVEFVGIAGSGKTFLAKRVADALVENGIPVLQLELGYKHYLSFRYFCVLLRTILWTVRARPKTLFGWVRATSRWYSLQVRYAMARSVRGVYLVDEGYLHKFRLVRRISRRKDLMLSEHFQAEFLTPDSVVIVSCDAGTVIERRRERDKTLLDWGAMQAAVTGGMERSRKDAEALVERQAGLDLLEVFNGKDAVPEQCVWQIANYIIQRFNK